MVGDEWVGIGITYHKMLQSAQDVCCFSLNKRSSKMTKNYNLAKKGPTKQCPGLGSGVQVCYCDENCLNSVYWFKATNADGDHAVLKDCEGDIGQLLEHIFSCLKHIPENICVLFCFMLCLFIKERFVWWWCKLVILIYLQPQCCWFGGISASLFLVWKSVYASGAKIQVWIHGRTVFFSCRGKVICIIIYICVYRKLYMYICSQQQLSTLASSFVSSQFLPRKKTAEVTSKSA